VRAAIRRFVPALTSRLPDVRGRGRVTMLIDRLLTDFDDPRSYIATGIVNGFPLQLDLRPWGQKFAFYYREWEPEYIAALRRLYRGGDFVDVGSSLGLYVVCMSDLVGAHGATIRSIEPIAFNLERQKRNVALNGIEDLVEYAEVSLGAERATVHLRIDPLQADNNAIIADDGAVPSLVVPLDELAREWPRIGAMKIDVEGYEPKVIDGGRATIARHRPVILAEFNRERMTINRFDIEPSWQFLMSLGYRAFRLDGATMLPLAEPGQHENLFFLPPGND
jgi:FkbM family methyltransferase